MLEKVNKTQRTNAIQYQRLQLANKPLIKLLVLCPPQRI